MVKIGVDFRKIEERILSTVSAITFDALADAGLGSFGDYELIELSNEPDVDFMHIWVHRKSDGVEKLVRIRRDLYGKQESVENLLRELAVEIPVVFEDRKSSKMAAFAAAKISKKRLKTRTKESLKDFPDGCYLSDSEKEAIKMFHTAGQDICEGCRLIEECDARDGALVGVREKMEEEKKTAEKDREGKRSLAKKMAGTAMLDEAEEKDVVSQHHHSFGEPKYA